MKYESKFSHGGNNCIDKNINAIEKIVMEDREDGYQDYSEWWHGCEIIGNIFDDPELLEA